VRVCVFVCVCCNCFVFGVGFSVLPVQRQRRDRLGEQGCRWPDCADLLCLLGVFCPSTISLSARKCALVSGFILVAD
jgi:hypothetical protein